MIYLQKINDVLTTTNASELAINNFRSHWSLSLKDGSKQHAPFAGPAHFFLVPTFITFVSEWTSSSIDYCWRGWRCLNLCRSSAFADADADIGNIPARDAALLAKISKDIIVSLKLNELSLICIVVIFKMQRYLGWNFKSFIISAYVASIANGENTRIKFVPE